MERMVPQHIRIKDRLTPCACIGCHDRRNNIYQLCHAGDLYTICMTEKCDQHASHKKCILKVINILQLMGRLYPFFQLFILFIAVVPYVPFVEGKIDLLSVYADKCVWKRNRP